MFDTFLSSLQEIYPPKIYEFAYVTDGACDMWDIQRTELHLLKVGGNTPLVNYVSSVQTSCHSFQFKKRLNVPE